jgi:hypothetical protein
MTDLSGRCACGAVRYRFRATPIIVHCCHCLNCQRQTGSAFVLNAVIETANLEATGELAVIEVPRDRSPHDIHHCARCQIAVWSDYGRRPGIRFVRVGTLEDPRALAPDVHIYTHSKQPWLQLPTAVPAFPEFYDPKTFWSAEQADRWRRALATS